MLTSLLSVFDSIENFLATIAEALKFDILLWVFLGVFGVLVIMTLIRLRFTYEVRAIKSFKKINKYFMKKPYINESNLVEFNKLMKKIPYQLRDRWQFYMLNREGLPSGEMTLYHCVEQPIKTSNYKSTILMLEYIVKMCTAICLVLCLFAVGSASVLSALTLVRVLIIPVLFYILCELYIYFLNAKFNVNSVDLYEYYLSFIRNLDKASASIPDYVDYELLFTEKEIRDGIPVLREYLEKRALLDRLAREKAKQNESERENFDFTSLGIDGSLLVERAMNTSQDFLNSRNKLKDEIVKLESHKDKYNEQYIEVEKDHQRKLQTVKENLARLQAQLEASSNRIEANYIKKQQNQEKAKQLELEKNLEDLNIKYAQQMKFMEDEINKRQVEIEEDKQKVYEQMDAEFETYNEKVYTIIRNKIDENDADDLKVTRAELDDTRDKLARETQEKENLLLTLDIKQQQIDTLQSSIDALNEKLDKISSRDKRNVAKIYEENEQLKEQLAKLQQQPIENSQVVDTYDNTVDNETAEDNLGAEEEVTYYDKDGNVVDFSQYYDENGYFKEFPKVYDKDGNYYDFADYYDKYGNPINNDTQEENVDSTDSADSEEEVTYYDKDGNVVDFSQYYDENGYFKEFPKVYDKDGNYYDFADYYDKYGNPLNNETNENQEENLQQNSTDENLNEGVEASQNIENELPKEDSLNSENLDTIDNEPKTELVTEQTVVSDENANNEVENKQEPVEQTEYSDNDVVYYDKDGNVVDFEQYYDENGKLKEFPKVYDKDGNFYDFADYYDRDGNLLSSVKTDEEEPKKVENLEANANSEVVEAPKKKRGRPKKVQTEGEDKDQKVEEPKTKPKSTRKTTATKTGTTKKSTTAKKTKNGEDNQGAEKKTRSRTRKTSVKKDKPVNPENVSDKATAEVDSKNVDTKPKTTKPKTTKASSTKKTTSSTKKDKTQEEDAKKKTTKKSTNSGTKPKSSTKKSTATTKKSGTKKANEKVSKNDEDLDSLSNQIDSENAKLEKKQADLKNKITQTLSELQEKPTVDRDLEDIKNIIKKLKRQANEVNKSENGLSASEQKEINKQINKSLSELLMIMANKSKK